MQNSKPIIQTINEKIKYNNIKTDLIMVNNAKRFVSNNYLLIIYFQYSKN